MAKVNGQMITQLQTQLDQLTSLPLNAKKDSPRLLEMNVQVVLLLQQAASLLQNMVSYPQPAQHSLLDVLLLDKQDNGHHLPLDAHFVDLALWQLVSRSIQPAIDHATTLIADDSHRSKRQKTTSASEVSDAAASFQDFYMSQTTQAFGDELNQLRQEDGFSLPKLSLLIDSLHAGANIFSSAEKDLLAKVTQHKNLDPFHPGKTSLATFAQISKQ